MKLETAGDKRVLRSDAALTRVLGGMMLSLVGTIGWIVFASITQPSPWFMILIGIFALLCLAMMMAPDT